MSVRVIADLDLCQGHAMCAAEAPEIFRVRERLEDHDQVEVLLEEIPNPLRAKLDAAVRYCPNRVLSVQESPDADSTAQSTMENV